MTRLLIYTFTMFQSHPSSVRSSISERRSSETDIAGSGIEHGIEAFQKGEAIDEVKARPGGSSNVVDDQVHILRVAPDVGVEGSRPRLSIGSEPECDLNKHEQGKTDRNYQRSNIGGCLIDDIRR